MAAFTRRGRGFRPLLAARSGGPSPFRGHPFDLLVAEGGNVSYIEFEFEYPDGSVASGTIQTNEAGDDAECETTGHVIVG